MLEAAALIAAWTLGPHSTRLLQSVDCNDYRVIPIITPFVPVAVMVKTCLVLQTMLQLEHKPLHGSPPSSPVHFRMLGTTHN